MRRSTRRNRSAEGTASRRSRRIRRAPPSADRRAVRSPRCGGAQKRSLPHRDEGTDMTRVDGYAPIQEYAAIGDGRAIALVARDGSIDWLALPSLGSPPACAAILDAECGGRLRLEPEGGFETERRYLPETNVLETTFRGAGGAVRVTDAITKRAGDPLPWFELARRVEGLAGEVRVACTFEPRFPFGQI